MAPGPIVVCVCIAVLCSLHLTTCTGQSTYASGITSQNLSTALQSDSLDIPYEQQRIIPGISFNCSGAIISWKIGAQWRTGGNNHLFPHLQVWRNCGGGSTYFLVGDTVLFVPVSAGLISETDYVFTGTPDPVLEFQAGDILGIFQPRESRSRVRVYYDTSAGPTNYYIATGNDDQPRLISFVITGANGSADHLPLVTVGIGPSNYELLNEFEVTTALQSTSLTIPYEQQRIIPGIPLNCSGTITSWTIGAEWSENGNYFPHLQLWRSMDGCRYTLIGDTELTVSGGDERQRDNYVFTGTPDPAVWFQTGDILGIYQPRERRSRVRVYYDISTGPRNYYNYIRIRDVEDQEDFVICNADGMENGLPLLAVEITIDCEPLTDPENGVVVVTTITTDSLTATYNCNTGYELVGEAVRDCNCQDTGGLWTGMAPTCISLCPGPTDIVNGMMTFTGNSVGNTATYTCNFGFELIGSATTICTQVDVNSAAFSPAPPVCRQLCPDPADLINGVMTFTGNSDGDTATYTCNSGFELIGSASTTCTQVDVNSAAFSPVPPVCRPLCPDPADLMNSVVTFTGNSVSDTAIYTCNTGFELIGSASTTCTQVDASSAAFSPAPPECRLIDCGDRNDPENGQVTISPGLLAMNGFGATATYTCNTSTGYMLVGIAMQICQDNGQWSGVEPICRLADCGAPPPVENGDFNGTETIFQSVAEYRCNKGFTLSGSQSRTCQATGTWSGADPLCIDPTNPGGNTQSESPGPIIAGVVGGVVVIALIALVIILAIIFVRRRRMAATNISLELQPKVSNRASDQATFTHFQHTELDIETSGNAAYVISADAIPASHNEAYAITNAIAITTSQNEAYGSLKPGGKDSDDYRYVVNQLDYEASDQYDYVTR